MVKLSDHPDYVKFIPLKPWEFAMLAVQQGGLCGCGCGEPLEFGPRLIRQEHLHQRATGGQHTLKNVSLWRVKPCAVAKDKRDSLDRKKLRSLTKTTKKSQRPKAKIQSRGFDKTKTKRMDGTVVSR